MKKFFAIAAMMLASVGAFAQYSAGDVTIQPKVGLNCASLTEDDADYKADFVGGIEAEYHISPLVGISGGLLYSMQGCKAKDIDDAKINLDYINIPILANFYVAKGFAFKAGIQPAFNVSSKVKYQGVSIDYNKYAPNGAEVKSFDFAIPIGVSYEYQGFVLDARYNIGVTKVVDMDGAGKNSVFQLTLGYKFKL